MTRKKTLGRGLGALLGSDSYDDLQSQGELDKAAEVEDENPEQIVLVEIDKLTARDDQPRKHFDEKALRDLGDSILEHGLLQPLLVRRLGDNFEIIAGERRYRASKMAGLKELPVVVRSGDEKWIREISLIENIQREDLNPIEEAIAYKELMEDFALTQMDLSARVGKSRSYIANIVRLLNLEPDIQEYIINGELSSSQGRSLLSIEDEEERQQVLEGFLNRKINIRDVEGRTRKKRESVPKDIYVVDLENRLTDALSARVNLKQKGKGGTLEIEYFDNDDLERITELLEKGD